MERYTVEQSKPSQGGAVLSTLTINNVMETDFQSTYSCTAWNAFRPRTMIITLAHTHTHTLRLTHTHKDTHTHTHTHTHTPTHTHTHIRKHTHTHTHTHTDV